ncbi:aldehyde dehydrogenase family protein, partial [Endozoicomonas sp. SESOKO3]|uniref:aldehyde dehydrogenase family protein n=1 Tax=Endozoicomonas sp. SESOKO3 TaxID=2828744 RepID=UPI002148DB23
MSLPCYQNFVDGQYLANETKETFPVINPATRQIIYTVEKADDAIRQSAVASAQKGFESWSRMNGMERSRILNRAVSLLRERNDELARIEVLDTGKPWQEASVVDVVTGADSIEFLAGLA